LKDKQKIISQETTISDSGAKVEINPLNKLIENQIKKSVD